jgi:hypothetical protein
VLVIANPGSNQASTVTLTPVGSVDAINLQGAVGELDAEKVAIGPSGHSIPKVWRGTQAEYDALTVEDGVLYFVLPDANATVVAVYVGRTGSVIPSGQWNFSDYRQSGHLLTLRV